MAEETYYYAGLIVTSIGVEAIEGKDGKVKFSEASDNGTKATFLKEIKMISDPKKVDEGKREFEATEVSLDEAKSIIAKGFGGTDVTDSVTCTPLFIVHGFNVEPSATLSYPYGGFKEDMAHYPVPVIWASQGSTLLYLEDQNEDAIAAGKAMEALVNSIPNEAFPRKSLLMHSMGNHAIFNGACADKAPDASFENIFMVAAVSESTCILFNTVAK